MVRDPTTPTASWLATIDGEFQDWTGQSGGMVIGGKPVLDVGAGDLPNQIALIVGPGNTGTGPKTWALDDTLQLITNNGVIPPASGTTS